MTKKRHISKGYSLADKAPVVKKQEKKPLGLVKRREKIKSSIRYSPAAYNALQNLQSRLLKFTPTEVSNTYILELVLCYFDSLKDKQFEDMVRKAMDELAKAKEKLRG